MTKDEALCKVKGYLTDIIPAENYSEVEEIIKALEQEPYKDCISKQDAIKIIKNRIEKSEVGESVDHDQVIVDIKLFPSAGPKTGRWIKIPEFCGDDVSGFIDNHFSCSECKKEAEINLWGFYILSDFCPNCGVKMIGEEE